MEVQATQRIVGVLVKVFSLYYYYYSHTVFNTLSFFFNKNLTQIIRTRKRVGVFVSTNNILYKILNLTIFF